MRFEMRSLNLKGDAGQFFLTFEVRRSKLPLFVSALVAIASNLEPQTSKLLLTYHPQT